MNTFHKMYIIGRGALHTMDRRQKKTRQAIIDAARDTGAIVTAEEHSVIGGLGGAVSEVICETVPVPVVKLGVEDVFGRSGPAVELLHIYGLDAENIVKKTKQALELKAAR